MLSGAEQYEFEPENNESSLAGSVPEEETQAFGEESRPFWLLGLDILHAAGFTAFTASVTALCLIISFAAGSWMLALHFKHKAEIAKLKAEQAEERTRLADPANLEARLSVAQQQLTELKSQVSAQTADRVLSNQELLTIQNQALQTELDDLARPQLDAPIVELDPSRGKGPQDKQVYTMVNVPPTSQSFTLLIKRPAEKVFPSYQLEMLDARKNKTTWSTQLRPEPNRDPVLTLYKRGYPAGQYRLRLTGINGRQKEVLETYGFEVNYLPPPKQPKKK